MIHENSLCRIYLQTAENGFIRTVLGNVAVLGTENIGANISYYWHWRECYYCHGSHKVTI